MSFMRSEKSSRNYVLICARRIMYKPSGAIPNHGQQISRARLEFYRDLLNQLGASRVAVLPASVQIDLLGPHRCSGDITAWSIGMLDSGDAKMWVFGDITRGKDDLVVANLENIDFKHTVRRFGRDSVHGHRTYWRRLDSGWWLQWDHWE